MQVLATGTRIGPHVLMQAIGSGAMSRVYRARRDSDDVVVALKVIPTSSAQRRSRFESEVASLEKVCHPGIVDVIDSGQDANWMWLAMELVDGIPLDDWIGRLSGTTRIRHILLAGVEIADALTAVHDQGLVHRDLKPANILMTKGGHIKLMDFGFADRVDAPVQAPTAGTLRYMAPERLTGSTGDRRADLFSLGVVLFELLSRRPPHVGLDHNRLILSQCTEPAPSVAEFAPEVPQQAVDVIDHMLAKPLAQRPRTAQAVADALRQALAQEPRLANWRPALRISHFVGHKTILETLLQAALSRKATTVILHGPPGVGLSRILYELQGRTLLRGARPVLISGGRRLLFRVLDSLAGPMRPAAVRHALLGTDRDLLLAAWPELSRPTEDVVCLARPPAPIDLVQALQRVLLRAAAQHPLVISIDNADQVDARDLSMLQGAGLLLLATHSPEALPLPCERIAVPPLERAQLETLAGTMLGHIIGPRLVMENVGMLAGLPGRLVALARGDIPWGASPATPPRHEGAPIRPWESAVEAAESALANRSPTEALQVLAESSPATAAANLMYRAELVRSRAALQEGDIPRARACAVTAAAIAPSAPDRSDALLTEAAAALRDHDLPEVERLGHAAAAAADQLAQPDLAARWRVLTARARVRAGALHAASEALSPYDDHLPEQAAAAIGVSWTRAQIAIHRCEWANARRYLLTARARAQDSGTRRTQAGLRAEVGHFWLRRGQIDKAIGQLQRAHQDLALTEDTELLALVRAHLGEARLVGGEVDEAGRLVSDALRTAKKARSTFATQESLRVGLRHAHISADIGRLGELVSQAQDLLLQRPLDPWGAAMAAQTALGQLELGDKDAAHRWLTHATSLTPEDPYHQQLVRLAQLAFQARTHDFDPAATAQLSSTCRKLGLDHLSRLTVGFTVRCTDKAELTLPSTFILDANKSGDRYAACWLSLALTSGKSAARTVRALGYVAMAAGVALPA